MTMRMAVSLLALAAAAAAGQLGGKAQLVGGTLSGIPGGATGMVRTADADAFIFETAGSTLRIPYSRINLVEYGQDASRRVVLAWVISPIFLLSKSRKHFITLGYTDEEGRQQAVVLRVDKGLVRPALAALEARTGRSVQYQDAEARKFRKG